MKLLLLSDSKNAHTKKWVSVLAKKDISIFLFSLGKDNTGFYSIFSNVEVLEYSLLNNVKNRERSTSFDKLGYLKVLGTLNKIIRSFKPDVLHAHYATSYGLLGSMTNFHPFIISVWGSDVYLFPKISFFHRKLLEFNFKKADVITSTSRNMVVELKKYTNKFVYYVPFGINTNIFFPCEKKSKSFTVGIVKGLAKIYKIDILIYAIKILVQKNQDKNIQLLIIGEGEDEQRLKAIVAEENLGNNVFFVGHVENNSLPSYYSSFSVFSVLSESESFGVVVLEAMSCKCPVVCSDAQGFLEVVPSECGIIVPKNDPEAAAKAIQFFIDNKDERIRMGEAARKHVVENYSWDKNVEDMCSIYNEL